MTEKKKISVLGAGTWGIAIARMLALCGHSVCVWSALDSEISVLTEKNEHPNLPGVKIPDIIDYTLDVEKACTGRDIIVFAVTSKFIRSTAERTKPYIAPGQLIVSVVKGIEAGTHFTMTDVLHDVFGKQKMKIVALSGPTHAEEVARDLPTTIVSACEDLKAAEEIQDVFMNSFLRVYTNTDILGVELCGALKNIIALAAGISKGLGFGDNASAALITRGMAEISRLGLKMGCLHETFLGLAGMGDLIVTATSVHSRNFTAGRLIGEGCTASEAIEKVGMVVEGINALPAAMELAKQYSVDMPITFTVNEVISNGMDPREATTFLMNGSKKSELSIHRKD